MSKILSFFLFLIFFTANLSSAQTTNSIKPNAQLADAQFEKAEVFMESRVFDSAYIYYMDCWKFYVNSDNWERKAHIMNQVCGISYKTGKFDEAIAYADSALFILQEANADSLHHLYGSVYHQYGTVQHILGNFKTARDLYKKAIEVRETEDPKVSMVDRTYNNLGLALTRLSDYDEAINYLKKNVSFCLKYHADDYYNIGRSYSNLGVAYSDKMDLENAEKFYKLGLRYYLMVLEEPDNLLGDVYMNLSKISTNDSNFVQSVKLLKKAIYNYSSTNVYHRNAPMVYLNLAVTYKSMGKYDSALLYIDKAIELKKEQFGDKNQDLAHTYQFKGRIYHAIGNYKEALKYFQQSIISNVLDFNDTTLTSLPELSGVLYPKMLAGSLMWKGTAWRDKYFETRNIEYLESSLDSYYAFDQLTDMMFFDFENDNSRFQLINDFFDAYYEAMQIAYELYTFTQDSKYAEDALFFSEKCKSALLTNGISESNAKLFANIPSDVLDRERNIREHFASIENQYNETLLYDPEDSATLFTLSDSLFDIKLDLDHLVDQFEHEYPAYYDLKYKRDPVSVSFLKNKVIDNKTALIEYFLGDTSLFIISITKEDVILARCEVDEEFNRNLEEFMKSTSDYAYITNNPVESRNNYLTSASYLFESLFPEEIIEQINTKKDLCIVPDNKLAYISFDALLTEGFEGSDIDFSTLPYLIKQFSIQYTYSATLLSNKNKNSELENLYAGFAPEYNTVMLAQADELKDYPKFRDNIGPLTENKSEITSANEVFEGTAYLAEDATEKNFKENAGNYSIIHLAMHAVLDDKNPLSSKLIFSQTNDTVEDNFLNTYEIYNLSLGSDLAILSACNTANGILDEGEGVLSLSRAFKYAGVNSIVSSLWLAHDETTKNIMLGFFNGIKDKLPLDKALRISKLNYLNNADPQFSHPYFWANFMLIGDNEQIIMKVQWFKNNVFFFAGIGLVLLITVFWFVRRKSF